jgi:hypothetical protein
MSDLIWFRLLAYADRVHREERADSMINWLVLAVGLAVAAAAVVTLLRPAIESAAQSIVNIISGAGG